MICERSGSTEIMFYDDLRYSIMSMTRRDYMHLQPEEPQETFIKA